MASSRPRLTDRQRIAWLRLTRTPNVGAATFRDLISRYGSAETAIEMLPELALSGGGQRPLRIPSAAEAERELEAARKCGAHVVAIGETEYPRMLRYTDLPPPLIAIKGDLSIFQSPAVSIVGSRNASLGGIKIAHSLASGLGAAGYAVVSGLARGIDTAAHEGALSTGTVAVMAGGLDQPYPPENIGLSDRIATGKGALISEMPFGWEPRAKDFPRRNRLIAALSLGLVVVEAAQRSGSLISARLAGEMGRQVFAVPGSPLDLRAAGTNALLKDGAVLVTEAADIIGQLAPMTGARPVPAAAPTEPPPDLSSVAPPADRDRNRIMEVLGTAPVHVDEIMRHTGMTAAELSLALLELDLAGRLERHPGGHISLIAG